MQQVFTFSKCQEVGVAGRGSQSGQCINSLEDAIPSMLQSRNKICQAINDALSDTGKSTCPATGGFNLKDRAITPGGELLMTAQYKA